MNDPRQQEQVDGISERIVNGVCVQRVSPRLMQNVEQSDFTFCNTDNHRDTERYRQLEADENNRDWYAERMQETRMERWLQALGDLVRTPDCVVTISPKQLRNYFTAQVKQRAYKVVCCATGYTEEATLLAKEIQDSQGPLEPPPEGWFVRTSACSTKDAQADGGAGPHFSLVDAILALFGSKRVHDTLKDRTQDVKVYLVPFDRSVKIEKELRVFVCNNQVTAVSQYDVFKPSNVFSPMSETELAKVARCVDAFHREQVVPRWNGIESYVMDVECITNGGQDPTIRLIELNSFGAEMAAASALFHWVRDENELYSSERLCIRVRAGDHDENVEEE